MTYRYILLYSELKFVLCDSRIVSSVNNIILAKKSRNGESDVRKNSQQWYICHVLNSYQKKIANHLEWASNRLIR